MRPGYTGIMVGDGDELGDEFVRAHGCDEALLFASRKQSSAEIWVHIGNDAGVADLETAFRTASFAQCGRLVLLPVQSQHMVFPPNDAYDISPDRLDDLLRNIRLLERKRRGEDPPRESPLPLISWVTRSRPP